MITDEMIRHESGTPDTHEGRWFAFIRKVEQLLGLDLLDGDEDEDGYSLDFAYRAFERNETAEAYAAAARGKHRGLHCGDHCPNSCTWCGGIQ